MQIFVIDCCCTKFTSLKTKIREGERERRKHTLQPFQVFPLFVSLSFLSFFPKRFFSGVFSDNLFRNILFLLSCSCLLSPVRSPSPPSPPLLSRIYLFFLLLICICFNEQLLPLSLSLPLVLDIDRNRRCQISIAIEDAKPYYLLRVSKTLFLTKKP